MSDKLVVSFCVKVGCEIILSADDTLKEIKSHSARYGGARKRGFHVSGTSIAGKYDGKRYRMNDRNPSTEYIVGSKLAQPF